MSMKLYAHPFSSYCQKVLIALYENKTPSEFRKLGDEKTDAELEVLWPLKRMPLLVDQGRKGVEGKKRSGFRGSLFGTYVPEFNTGVCFRKGRSIPFGNAMKKGAGKVSWTSFDSSCQGMAVGATSAATP